MSSSGVLSLGHQHRIDRLVRQFGIVERVVEPAALKA